MNDIPIAHYLYLAAALFGLGVFGVLARRNAVSILIGIELMLNAVNINFLAFAKYWNWSSLSGPVFVVFVITIAAAEAAVVLAIIISMYRQFKSANVGDARDLHG
jgi:NADH-quinone oxidoreductase subunit K